MTKAMKRILLVTTCGCLLLLNGCGDGSSSHDSSGATRLLAGSMAAPANYATSVQQLYVAYFGRPADPVGLANFQTALSTAGAPTDIQGLAAAYSTNPSIKSLIDSFGASAESNSLYAGDTQVFVKAIFNNLLNRDPQSAGLQYWTDAIDSGVLGRGNAALSIMAGSLRNTSAQGLIDATTVNNKILIASGFTSSLGNTAQINVYKGSTAAATVRAMLRKVDNLATTESFQTTMSSAIGSIVTTAYGGNGGCISATEIGYAGVLTSTVAAAFSPNKLTCVYFGGNGLDVAVEVTASTSITGSVYVRIVDSRGVLSTNAISLTKNSTYSYTATLKFSELLAVGNYVGSFNISLCKDANCISQWAGSPVNLPYDIQVLSSSAAPPAATTSPNSLDVTLYQGDITSFNVTANFKPGSTVCTYSYASDDTGVLVSRYKPPGLVMGSCMSAFNFEMQIAPGLGLNNYSGSVKLHFCHDSACTSEMLGSPVSVPYTIKILSANNPTSLSRWSGISDWGNFQGNTAHNGYVPVTLDKSRFIERWHQTISSCVNTTCAFSPAVIANGLVYVQLFGDAKLFAFYETDGKLKWQVNARDTESNFTTLPQANDSSVYIAMENSAATNYLYGLRNTDGSTAYQSPLTYVPDGLNNAMVLSNDALYILLQNGVITQMDSITGMVGWNTWWSLQLFMSMPAIDSNYAYTYSTDVTGANKTGLWVVNITDGKPVYLIADPINPYTNSGQTGTPVITSHQSVIQIRQGALGNFDLNARNIKWSVSGSYEPKYAVDSDVIYAFHQTRARLEARRISDGALLWSWMPEPNDGEFEGGNIIVTDNMVLLSTNKVVHAIDKNSHTTVWKYFHSGNLALSANGILYISGTELHAVNMK